MNSECATADPETGRIPIAKPCFGEEEEAAVCEVLRSGWVVQGPRVAAFEEGFKKFLRVTEAVATSSCTTALHLALHAAGIGPGDEVLVPSFTFIASANAIEYVGARPVFVDINLATYTIAPRKMEEYLHECSRQGRKPPRAVMPVSLFGLCADMGEITRIAGTYDLLVIEDAACGFGASRAGRPAGTEALVGCFSFHPRKAITTGEGGMVVTNDARIAHAVRVLRDHGASKSDLERPAAQGGSLLPEYPVLGYNYRMTDLQGALGVAQIEKAATILQKRRDAAVYYDHLLEEVDEIAPPFTPRGFAHAYQSYVCLYQGRERYPAEDEETDWEKSAGFNQERNRLMAVLEERGISMRQGTHAVHTLEYYQQKYGLADRDLPRAYLADRLSIALPLYCGITPGEQERVIRELKTALSAS
jgi:perosamine synthetase